MVVEFEKFLLAPLVAAGVTVTETMRFVNWDDACDWAGKCTMSTKVPFVVLEMRGPNGEVEKF
jgi:hypothetical protein